MDPKRGKIIYWAILAIAVILLAVQVVFLTTRASIGHTSYIRVSAIFGIVANLLVIVASLLSIRWMLQKSNQ